MGFILIQDADSGSDSGDVVPESSEEANISPLDRGFLYGDAVFETLRCYNSSPVFVSRHVERMNRALDELGIPVSVNGDGLETRIERVVSEIDERDAYVRVCVTRGEREGMLKPTEESPTFVTLAKGREKRRYEPASLETVETRRPRGVLGELKTHNYLPNILAKAELRDGTDEAVMLDDDGMVASGAVSNLFVVTESGIATPGENVRKGVTRSVVLEIAREFGLETEIRPISVEDIHNSPCFLTNSGWGIRGVESIDGKELPDDAIIRELRQAYFDRAL